MIVVGLTGGIGSGKTTVAGFFRELGVPVYIADVEAKRLMNTSKVIKRNLIFLFGNEAYIDNQLNRPYIASKIFNNAYLLSRMNAIVHPKVGEDFRRWVEKQNSPYVIKEAAIIFEQQKQSDYDYIITVTSNAKDKIDRILKRDATSESKVKAIMKSQMSDEEKIEKSDFVIVNEELGDTKKQVQKIHELLLQNSSKP